MPSVTVGQLIDRAAEFERLLESHYAKTCAATEDDGVRILTFYLSHHRRRLEKALESFEPSQIERIRRVRLRFDSSFEPKLGSASAPPDLKASEVLESAASDDARLVELYRLMLDQPVGEEAERLLQSLVGLEERDIVMLKKMKAMDYF